MKKLLTILTLGVVLLFLASETKAASTGIYFCRWGVQNGQPTCLLNDNQCSTNFTDNCAQFTTQATCNNNQQSAGNDCVADVPEPPDPGSCGAGACTTSSDCAGGRACLGADAAVACSGFCACAPSRCNGPLDCNGSLASCENIQAGQWCSGQCVFAENDDDPLHTNFIGYCGGDRGINTAIGCIPITSLNDLSAFFLRWGLGISGGVAIIMLVYSSFLIMTSAGDPKRLETGKELLFSTLSGIVLMTFCVFVLRIIGINVLGIF